jgi:hypothetical protein
MVSEQWAPLHFEKRAFAEDRPGGRLCSGTFQPLHGRFSPNSEQTHSINWEL